MEQMLRAIDSMAANLERLASNIDGVGRTAETTTKKIETALEKPRKGITTFFVNTRKEYDVMIKDMVTRVDFFSARQFDAIEKLERRYKRFASEVKRHLTEVNGVVADGGSMMGLTGPRGPVAALSSIKNSMLAQLPMGGLLGLALYGAMREEHFRAGATQIARTFDQVGGYSKKNITDITRDLKAFYKAWGSGGEEIQATIQNFVQFGIAAKDAVQIATLGGNSFGRSIASVSTHFDLLNKANPGTTAQLIGQAFEASGKPIQEVADDVFRLGMAARQAGINYTALTQTMMQATSGLRLQRQGVGDLAQSYFKLREGFAVGGGLPGANQAAINRAAMSGLQAAASGVASLPEGLMAVVGQRIGAQRGTQFGGIEALIAMQEGNAGGQGQHFGDVVRELGKMAEEITGRGSREEQIFALMKVAPGLGFEGSRAVVDMKDGKGTMKDVADAIKNPQKILNEAFKKRAEEQNAFENAMRRLMAELADIGSGTLTVLIAGLSNIGTSLRAINPLLSADERATATQRSIATATAMEGGFEAIFKGLENSGGIIDDLGGRSTRGAMNPGLRGMIKALRSSAAEEKKERNKGFDAEGGTQNLAMKTAQDILRGIKGSDTLTPDQRMRATRIIKSTLLDAAGGDTPEERQANLNRALKDKDRRGVAELYGETADRLANKGLILPADGGYEIVIKKLNAGKIEARN